MAREGDLEIVMAEPDIMGIANDRAHNIRDYVVFDPNATNIEIVRQENTAAQFEFTPMLFQMLQTVSQFFGAVTDNPHLHLKQFLQVASNFKILGNTDEAFKLRLFPYSLRCGAKSG
jgi:hypothetical protein